MGGKIGWTNWVAIWVETLSGKLGVQIVLKKSVQCTVFIVQSTMYSKLVLLSLWRQAQCSSVWGVETFARLLLCLTPPEESSHLGF